MHEVKAALVTAGWDTDAAMADLQRRGLNAAAKKAWRLALARAVQF